MRGMDETDLRGSVFAAVRDAGLVLLSMKPTGLSLEELFLKLTVKGEM